MCVSLAAVEHVCDDDDGNGDNDGGEDDDEGDDGVRSSSLSWPEAPLCWPDAGGGCGPGPAPRGSGARAGPGSSPCSERTCCETASPAAGPATDTTHGSTTGLALLTYFPLVKLSKNLLKTEINRKKTKITS